MLLLMPNIVTYNKQYNRVIADLNVWPLYVENITATPLSVILMFYLFAKTM